MFIPVYEEDNIEIAHDESSLFSAFGLILTVSIILLLGLTMLYSTTSGTAGGPFGATLFIKQLVWSILGTSLAFTIVLVGYKKISDYYWFYLIFSFVLLIIAGFFCPAVKGAHRWIRIPGVGNIQPSEFAKIAVVIFMAKYCSDKMRHMNSLSIKKGLIPACAISGTLLLLIFLGKDWGTTFLLGIVVMIILFIAGVKLRYMVLPFLLAPIVPWYLKNHDKERWSRLTTFLEPELYRQGDTYQLWNSILALGSGNWLGLGFTESRMKAKYLPEAHTDFILSIVGEELGFTFMCLIIFLYVLFIIFAVKICVRASTRQGMLLGIGITAMISLQAFINIGVVSGALPTKGMPAPFISYGGSNLIICITGVGFLISIAMESANVNLLTELPVLKYLKTRFWDKR